MTDNKVYVNQHGNESVQVNRADGLGVAGLRKMGISQIIISSETNAVVKQRARKLGIFCLQGVSDKEKELKSYCSNLNINLMNVIYVGNDINDRKAMECVGWPICPNDAHESVRDISRYVLENKGGEGIVRELMDLITIRR